MDEVSGRLNTGERGIFLGDFDTGNAILAVYKDGTYEVADLDLMRRFDPKEIISIQKFDSQTVINSVYYDGLKGWTMVKRFQIETSTNNQRFNYLTEHKSSKLLFASIKENPRITYSMKVKSKKIEGEINIAEFIEVKGWKALGNKLSDQKLSGVKEIETSSLKDKLTAGDSIEFDIDDTGQSKMF
jgi:topoisomerase-4 subunit A